MRLTSVRSNSQPNVLDKMYVVSCGCGYVRDCGYMGVTADRLADWHRERGESHEVTIMVSDAEELTPRVMNSRSYASRRRENMVRLS